MRDVQQDKAHRKDFFQFCCKSSEMSSFWCLVITYKRARDSSLHSE